MVSTKAALKAAKQAVDAQEYDQAITEAKKVLESDSSNYFGNVFLGLALDKQGQNEESENAYNTATTAKPDDATAWQGLIALYEKQGNKKLDSYADAVRNLGQVYANVDDRHKCQTVVDKYLDFAKQHGTRMQLRHAYDLIVPGSPLYDCLEGRVPKADFTYMRIAELIEEDEKERISRMIAERRTRLGARIGQVTVEAKREVYTSSDLEALYQGIIDYSHDDELRRLYEEKLLVRAYDVMSVLPAQHKEMKRQHVQKLAEGMVIIKVPVELAWRIVLEWRDVESMQDWDATLLRQYVELLPEDGLAKVLRGFLESEICPFPKVEAEKTATPEGEEEEPPEKLTADDRLVLMTEGLEESSRSVLSQRIMCEYYLYLEEYASAVETSRRALDLIAQEERTTGLNFQNRADGANIVLATSLIRHETPRHHSEARQIFKDVLARKPNNLAALIGVGLILKENEDFAAAFDFLSQAAQQNPTIQVRSEAAWCKALIGRYEEALAELDVCLGDIRVIDEKTNNLKAELLYRSGYCIWNIDTSRAARKDRTGAYARWLECLQLNIDYAPVYTSLGTFYSDYSKSKERARKCFQKAFELSSSELYAAERLARAFADAGDWDLVETVSQRVVDSGKAQPPPGSKRKALSWPYAALGICYLNKQEHAKAVPMFTKALRVDPSDYHSLVGLGESYHSLGRFVAATRTFEEAKKYEENVPAEDVWFARYMLANVHRDLGDFEEAIAGYEAVLSIKEDEFGVLIALLQAFVDSAWHNYSTGLFGRAIKAATRAIEAAQSLVNIRPEAFNLWKPLGEACSIYACLGGYASEIPRDEVRRIFGVGATEATYEHLSDIDHVKLEALSEASSSKEVQQDVAFAMRASILANKRGITVSAKDIHAQAVSWYNLGWAEYKAHTTLIDTVANEADARASKYLRAAVRCFKRAIELEARNPEFWNALGIITTPLNAKVAQHAFVRSLYINDKSAAVWTNLGTLYLLQNDYELAREAFTRAQSTDPTYTHAWVAQGILALLHGDAKDARASFTHAFEISDSASTITKKLYTTSTFDHIVSSHFTSEVADLILPVFALQQLRTQTPNDIVSRHLSALLAERLNSYADSIDALTIVSAAAEADYEQSESPESLARFAQAQADLARAQLASGNFSAAVEHADMALDLSAESESGLLDPEGRRKYRLSAHLAAGLAQNRLNKANESIGMFRAALTESLDDPDVICLLAQVLWAKGGSNERDVAREQLFSCVEQHPEHANSIILLAVIALLEDDVETVEAVASDLHGLRARADIDDKNQLKIGKLLEIFAQLQPGALGADAETAQQAEATVSIMLAPAKPHGWTQLADVSDDPHAAEMALLTATNAAPPKGSLDAATLSEAHVRTHRAADAQRAVMLAPWIASNWKGFAEVLDVQG